MKLFSNIYSDKVRKVGLKPRYWRTRRIVHIYIRPYNYVTPKGSNCKLILTLIVNYAYVIALFLLIL